MDVAIKRPVFSGKKRDDKKFVPDQTNGCMRYTEYVASPSLDKG